MSPAKTLPAPPSAAVEGRKARARLSVVGSYGMGGRCSAGAAVMEHPPAHGTRGMMSEAGLLVRMARLPGFSRHARYGASPGIAFHTDRLVFEAVIVLADEFAQLGP
jgi:hypothetical protein